MGTELAPFAQFGVAGLLAGIAYALVRWALNRADEDRKELQQLNLWVREKGWAAMAEIGRTMDLSVDLVERQSRIIDKLSDKLDASAPPVRRTAR